MSSWLIDAHHLPALLSGGTRARAVSFGCEGRLGVEARTPVDATFRLERNVWNGAVEPRLLLRHARPCAPPAIEVLGEAEDYLGSMLAELALELELEPAGAVGPPVANATLDRRGESPLAVLADALCAGGPVLAVCADVARRLTGLASAWGDLG